MPNIFSRPTTNDKVSVSRGSMPDGVDPSQWEANPYANFDYRHSGWQKFLEGLGFRSKYDEFVESMALNAREYDAQLTEKAHNEEFDSALAQASRERLAGINPDLAGNVDAGGSSSMEPDPNGPIEPGNDFDSIMQFGSTIMSAVQMAFGLAQSGIGLASGLQSLRGQKIANDNAVLNAAAGAVGYVFNPYEEESPEPHHPSSYPYSLKNLFGSRRYKKYLSAFDQIAQSLYGQQTEYSMRSARAKSRTEYIDQVVSPGYDEVSEAMKDVRQTLQEDLWSELKNAQKYRNLKSQSDVEYQEAYNQAHGGKSRAKADVSLAGLDVSESEQSVRGKRISNDLSEFRYAMRESFDHLIAKMNKRADEGNNFASFLSVVLSFLGIRMLGL